MATIQQMAAAAAKAEAEHRSVCVKMLMEDPRMQRFIGECGGDPARVTKLMETVCHYGFSCGLEHFVETLVQGIVAMEATGNEIRH